MAPQIRNGLLLGAIIFSILWLGFGIYYIANQYGWENIKYLLPHEIGTIILALVIPVIFLWLFVFMGIRRDELQEHTAELRKRLSELVFSGPDAARKTANLVSVLREQTEELRKATSDANEMLAGANDQLRQQSELLNEALQKGLHQAQESSERLTEERHVLERIDESLKGSEQALSEILAERSQALTRAAEQISEKILLTMNQGLEREAQLRASLTEQVDVLNKVADEATGRLAEALETQADKAANRTNVALAHMMQSSRDLQTQLTDQAQKILAENKALTEGVVATLARLNEDIKLSATESKGEYAKLRQAISVEQANIQESVKGARGQLLEGMIHAKEDLDQMASDTTRQIEDLGERLLRILGEQQAIVTAAAETSGFGEEMRYFEDSFAKMLGESTQTAQNLYAHLKGQTDEYQKVLDRLNVESQVIGSVFRVEANSLNEAAERITGKAGEMQDHMRQFIGRLEEDAETAREKWAETRQLIEQQSALLSKTTAQHIIRIEEMKSVYHAHNEVSRDAGEKLEQKLAHSKEQLQSVTALLEEEAGKAVHKSEHLAYLLSARAKEIENVTMGAHDQFTSLTGQIGEVSEKMREALHESADRSQTTLDAFREASENLTQVARKTAIHLGSIKLSAEEQINDLTHIATQMNDIADKLRGDMRDQTNQFTEAVKHLARLARDEAGDTAGTLTRHAEELKEAIEKVAQASHQTSIDMLEKIEEVKKSVEFTAERSTHVGEGLHHHATLLKETIEMASGSAEGMSDKFRAQSLELAKGAEAAFVRMEELSKRQQATSKDIFLRAAGSLVEELNALALDMHNMLDNEIPEKIWRRYRDGDRGIFARRLFRSKDEFMIPAIQQRYETDERFKDMIDRYIGKFEDLFGRANLADPDSVLPATFITADIGKLYLVIARSLGRKVISW